MSGFLKTICRQPGHPYTATLVAAATRSGLKRYMHMEARTTQRIFGQGYAVLTFTPLC